VEAASGAEALSLLAQRLPDIVLLDVKLPDADGREICARIKSDPATATVAVLQTSAMHVEMRDRVASLDAGADGYLVEPMEPEELVANVRALLRLRRAEQERTRALDALREADRRKDEFLAMLAHELRNPLAPIRNAVEILRISEDRGVRERARQLVGRQVEHLARLVDDLLEVSRITRGKVALQRLPVRLAAVVRAALDLAKPQMESQRHEVDVVNDVPGDPWIDVDAVRMSQVLGNLLHNAAKFTPPGGKVRISTALAPDALVIAVEDNGSGIPADILPDIFELFAQGDRSLDRSRGGLGIGLSLARGLVEMHGGSVTASSAGRGQGSRFAVRLPRSVMVEAPAPAKAAAAPADSRARRVLVVEDNMDAAEAMVLLLRELGHDVHVVHDGHEAIDAARQFEPEVMLLDIGLPGLDGYELARRMRGLPALERALIVAVSGYGQEKDRQRSAAAGFDAHLVKPVDPRALIAVISAEASGTGSARRAGAS
jgi:signal transduction histidine kinase/BarA-like signal transduction histidine kinase